MRVVTILGWHLTITKVNNAGLEAELLHLFSGIARKELRFDLWYEDALARKVHNYVCCVICMYV